MTKTRSIHRSPTAAAPQTSASERKRATVAQQPRLSERATCPPAAASVTEGRVGRVRRTGCGRCISSAIAARAEQCSDCQDCDSDGIPASGPGAVVDHCCLRRSRQSSSSQPVVSRLHDTAARRIALDQAERTSGAATEHDERVRLPPRPAGLSRTGAEVACRPVTPSPSRTGSMLPGNPPGTPSSHSPSPGQTVWFLPEQRGAAGPQRVGLGGRHPSHRDPTRSTPSHWHDADRCIPIAGKETQTEVSHTPTHTRQSWSGFSA